MTHRYNTRFQAKKIQEEQRRASEQAALEKTVEYSRAAVIKIDKEPSLVGKIELLIIFYQHLYDEPLLLTNHERFRAATWEKMKDQEATLLVKLQTLPPRLGETREFWHLRSIIIQLLDLMEWVRAKYW